MYRKYVTLACFIFLYISGTNGQMATYISKMVGPGYYGGIYIRDSSIQVTKIGEISLKRSSITIEPHGSYLQVTEDATINPILTNYDGYGSLSFQGSLKLPIKSTITSVYIASDSAEYIGKIHPSYKQGHPVDTASGSALASLNWVVQGAQAKFDLYDFKIYDILPGKEYRIKIHYLIPNTGNASQLYPVRVLFNSAIQNPGIIELLYSPGTKERTLTLNINKMNLPIDKSTSLQIPYNDSFDVFTTDTVESSFHISEIDSGDWSGKYLLLNTKIPDSVITKMSTPIELVVLWRWNRPNSFVIKSNYSNSTFLTTYGYQAISQASAIKLLVNEIIATGNKTGLVHSIQYRQPEIFPLCQKNSSGFAKLDNYLGQFTSSYFLNSGYFEYDTRPDNPDDTVPDLTDSSRVEFLKSIKLVHGLYSNGNGILKHLVILSSGPVQISRNLITLEEIDTLLSTISVDCSPAVWRDVNFSLVKTASLNKTLYPFGSFYLPEFKPATVILQVENGSKQYSFPISCNQSSFSIIAKSNETWENKLSWTGLNASGSVIKTVQTEPLVYKSIADTGLVKLWAANNERLSETNESNISLKYGVVSEMTSLKILPSYKGYDSTATAFAQTSMFYVPDSIKTGIEHNIFASEGFHCYKIGRNLKLTFPASERITKIEFYLLSGRLLGEFSMEQFKTKDGYIIPVQILSNLVKSNTVLLRIYGEKRVFTHKLVF